VEFVLCANTGARLKHEERAARSKMLFTGILITVVLLAALIGGDYAIFSDQVQSDIQTFQSGTVDINVGGMEDEFLTAIHQADFSMGTG